MRVCVPKTASMGSERVAKQNRGCRTEPARFETFVGKTRARSDKIRPNLGCCRLTALLSGPGARARGACTAGAFARRVRSTVPISELSQAASASAPLAGSLQAGAPPKPHGRTQPGGEQPQPAPSRPAQCCGSPAGFASPTRRVELAAGGVETTVAGARVLGRSPRRTGAQAGLVSQPAGGEGAQAGGRGAAAQGWTSPGAHYPPAPPARVALAKPIPHPPHTTTTHTAYPLSRAAGEGGTASSSRRGAGGGRDGGGRGGGGGRSGDAGGGSGWR